MTETKLPLIEVPIVDYGTAETEMVAYREEGTARALDLDNRGPIRFTPDGCLDPEIIDAYDRHGFYVFTNVIDERELQEKVNTGHLHCPLQRIYILAPKITSL